MLLDKIMLAVMLVTILANGCDAVQCYECTIYGCDDPFDGAGVSTCSDLSCYKVKAEQGGK